MKTYDVLLFDLDGTLTDPSVGITNSVMYALRHMGVEPPERRTLYKFIGPPLMDSFAQEYGFSQEEARQAISWYREYFQDRGIFENAPYPGIADVLHALRGTGKRLLVATSKPEIFARRILERFGLIDAFEFVAGANLDETRTRKHEVIAYALETCGICEKDSAVMIGDREHDVLGARREGLDCIGVLYGFGSREELLGAGAIALAETVWDVARLLGVPVQ
ncbi:MAG TPA: HAD family hydrolase [Candidatus Alectryocaccomicrobium excrementavium]|uniref:HAD family hydrolase n=1 Tax=Candidatus Alectryocaccomicrobium excrementavium TaxID=2840668 RepID=A0A9D1FZK4_9FIRM|nr:HAD family hydrolase [Candidatus Alectryocaccomicrobium excrementavium]